MVDTLQRTSSLPLPEFQTGKGSHDPLPLNAPRELERVEDAGKQAAKQAARGRFEDYLNQTSIMVLEKVQAGRIFDPADEIAAQSVYIQPNGKTPI